MRFIPYSVQIRIVPLSVPDALEVSTLAWVVARGILNPSTSRRGTSTHSVEPSAGHEGDIIKLQTPLLPDASCLALCLIKSSCSPKNYSCHLIEDHKLSIWVVVLTQIKELSKCDHWNNLLFCLSDLRSAATDSCFQILLSIQKISLRENLLQIAF